MRSRSVLFTLFGDYIRHYGGEVSVSSLTRMMEELGFSPPAVRAAIFRMSRQGWLVSRRVGRSSFYSLTKQGLRRLDAGARRIYKVRPDLWDGRWRILTYSIQESERRNRDDLRTQLTWHGFGLLTTATWITPWDLRDQISDLIEQRQLGRHVAYFLADHRGFGTTEDLVRRCWDLESISANYQRFLAEWTPRAEEFYRLQAANEMQDNACFRERILLVHEWRKFLFVDPKLPAELLPQDWSGHRAAELFETMYQLVSPCATRFFDRVFEVASDRHTAIRSSF